MPYRSISPENRELLAPSPTRSFADVAHQTLSFDTTDPTSQLVMELLDTRWVQRLRSVRQTGNTYLVYMFAEHSRFGHSLGVAYLATLLMNNLAQFSPESVRPYQDAVGAAALLHDIGHTAPGSHLAAQLWSRGRADDHEKISMRIIQQNPELNDILRARDPELPELVCRILDEDPTLPHWTRAIISGGGWNADRGNWTIVDSAMCAVSYGRYNVMALIDAFRLSPDGELIIQESRMDALTHFFVARDSMYRQIYQHRVLQAADALAEKIVLRLCDILADCETDEARHKALNKLDVFCDDTMVHVLGAEHYAADLSLEDIYRMTEDWWGYHLMRWTTCGDAVLKDLAQRLCERRLFKTVRYDGANADGSRDAADAMPFSGAKLLQAATEISKELGFDPRYYVTVVDNTDKHRGRHEDAPMVLLDNGSFVDVTKIEPLIAELLERPEHERKWIAMPKEVKVELGHYR